jgi:uncharacterized protein YkwD
MKALIALFALAACMPAGPQRVIEPRLDAEPAPRGAVLLRTAMLHGHNAARAELGLPPLVWSDALAADAQVYAEELARTGRFEHADQPQGPGREGETLWIGTREAYRYDEMVGHWVAEKQYFVNGITPDFSTTGDYHDAVHYAQIVWRDTRRVGCALASNARDDVLVCRYDPPGNVVGERTY